MPTSAHASHDLMSYTYFKAEGLSAHFRLLSEIGLREPVMYGCGLAELDEGKKPHHLNVVAGLPTGGLAALEETLADRFIQFNPTINTVAERPHLSFEHLGRKLFVELYKDAVPSSADMASRAVVEAYAIAVAPNQPATVTPSYFHRAMGRRCS